MRELGGAGIPFAPPLICSVMLSRRLAPHLARHDLDSLASTYGLPVSVRHRALPDAELLWRWWQAVVCRMPAPIVEQALRELRQGPLLPAALDPSVVAALPEAPGAFVMHGDGDVALAAGAAANLRAHVTQYFRIGHASRRALEIAHRVRRISFRATRGMLGARLHALAAAPPDAARPAPVTWHHDPAAVPCVILGACDGHEAHGVFVSERKARNALSRLARAEHLCHRLLGLDEATCGAHGCPGANRSCGLPAAHRVRETLRAWQALRPWRVHAWPHAGPVAIRERGDLLVVDRWRFLGTARNDTDMHELLEQRPDRFDPRTYRILHRALARLPAARVVPVQASKTRALR